LDCDHVKVCGTAGSNKGISLAAERNSSGIKRALPPLPALRAFEAAARRLNFTEAANDLCLTPSAISHQVRSLEELLGTALFIREPHCLKLTRTGEAYLNDLTPILDALDASTRRVSHGRSADRLRVLTTPGFAARWLVPRLSRFDSRDQIAISVSQGAPSMDFSRNNADIVIHWGDTPVQGAVVEPMMESSRYPVANAQLAEREGLREPGDLLRSTLLHDEVDDGWEDWFIEAGLKPNGLPRGPRLAHCELTLSAAEQQQGIALAYDAMAKGALETGRIIRLFDIETPRRTIYSFAHAEGRHRCPDIRHFRSWILEEVSRQGLLSGGNHHDLTTSAKAG
jgi:LysR family transcriptional regulator, glycine cleavage system transcriptional activator